MSGLMLSPDNSPTANTRLFIASDGHEPCLWEGEPDDLSPRCVQRQSDVDPVVWSLIIGDLRVQIPREAS